MIAGVLGYLEAIVDRVSGARRNQTHVGDRSRGPRVALVDRVAVLVELKAAVEVSAGVDGPLPVIRRDAAVEQNASLVVDRLELDPDVERVDRAAGEEVPDLACPHDDLDADRIPSPDAHLDLVEWREHFRFFGKEVLRGAEVHRLFARREGARESRLLCRIRSAGPIPVPACRSRHARGRRRRPTPARCGGSPARP